MFKVTHSIIAAAAIAGVVTVLTGNSDRVGAGPLAEPAQSALKACTERPWPYLNCVGTRFGDPHIRLIASEHFAQ